MSASVLQTTFFIREDLWFYTVKETTEKLHPVWKHVLVVFSLKYKFLLVLKYFPLGFFLPTSVSHSLPNPLIHTHTHTILSLLCCRREKSYKEIKGWVELALRRMDMCYLEPRKRMSCAIDKMPYMNCFWLPSFNKKIWTLQHRGPSCWFFSKEVRVGRKEH